MNSDEIFDLSLIKENPDNPRFILDEKFTKLMRSIGSFPKMMSLRPIVVDENNMILGGNMRFKALISLGYSEVPSSWIKLANNLTNDEKEEFIIKDNAGFGNWDWDALANEWDNKLLTEWGLDIPVDKEEDDLEEDEKKEEFLLKIKFKTHEELNAAYKELGNKGYDCKIVE